MKVRLKLLLIIGLLLWAELAAAQVVEVPDPNLEELLREVLGLPAGESLTREVLLRLERIDAPRRGITDLTGLEHATNLKWLGLPNNEITDLSPLARLSRLEILYMWGNRVSDLSPLSNLTLLRELDLAGSRVSDLTPLANLTELELLNLGWNYLIEDIRPLANLTKLNSLWLPRNRIVDIGPLANLTELQELSIRGNPITDYSPLDGLALSVLERDEFCQFPPVPVEPRVQNRTFPSTFNAWGLITNLPRLSRSELQAHNDLFWHARSGLDWLETEQGFRLVGNLDEALKRRDALLALNPNMLFIVGMPMRSAGPYDFPEDSPYWLRDEDGNRVVASQYVDASSYQIDFTRPETQDMLVKRAVAAANCGLVDGIMFDWWNEHAVVLADDRFPWPEGY